MKTSTHGSLYRSLDASLSDTVAVPDHQLASQERSNVCRNELRRQSFKQCRSKLPFTALGLLSILFEDLSSSGFLFAQTVVCDHTMLRVKTQT